MGLNKKMDIFFNNIKCPYCKSEINNQFKSHEIPYYGEILLLTLICQNCGYKKNYLFSIYEKEPKRYIFKFNCELDLKIRVIRSGSSTIKIPEFGIIIEPGVESEGYITNIEGILLRINDILLDMENKTHDEEAETNIQDLKNKLIKSLEGKQEFTLILEDLTGDSAIISSDSSKLTVEKFK